MQSTRVTRFVSCFPLGYWRQVVILTIIVVGGDCGGISLYLKSEWKFWLQNFEPMRSIVYAGYASHFWALSELFVIGNCRYISLQLKPE